MSRESLKKLLFFMIGLSVFGVLLYQGQKLIDFTQVLREIRSQNLFLMLAVACMFTVSRYFQAIRFRALHSASLGNFEHMGISLAGQLVNALVPMRGGELVRPYYLLKMGKGSTLKTIILATVTDKFIEAFALIPLVLLGYFFYENEITLVLAPIFENAASSTVLLSITFVLICLFFGFRYFKRKNPELLNQIFKTQGVTRSYLYGLGHWVFFALGFAILIGDIKVALFVAIVVNFAAAVPVSPGALGVFEGAFIWSMAQVLPHQTGEKSLAQAVVLHFFFLAIPIIGGIIFFAKHGIPNKKKIEKLAAQSKGEA
jgi:uncharacterized membrane protein YbhN (UPF0104 family)